MPATLTEHETPTTDTDPLALCRCVVLPRTDTLLDAVERVRDCYLAATGESMDYRNAIHVLDQIRTERGLDVGKPSAAPIPTDLAPVACALKEFGYHDAMILIIVSHIRIFGTVRDCPAVEGEDAPYLEEIMASIRGGAR